jgi:hypothetical protein
MSIGQMQNRVARKAVQMVQFEYLKTRINRTNTNCKLPQSSQLIACCPDADGTCAEDRMNELVERIAKAIVDHPEAVRMKAAEGSQSTVLELRTHPLIWGK